MSDHGRAAIVTGGAGGIGKATAKRLAGVGFDVCIVDLNAELLESVAAEVAAFGGRVIHHAADVTRKSDVEASVAVALEAFGRVDALANIAGGAGPRNLEAIDEIADEDWDFVMQLNMKSTFMACRAVVPIMREQGYGRIANMSSTIAHGRLGPVGTAGNRLAYAAAKAGIIGFSRQLAKDVGKHGITVNAVLPWLILSEQGTRIRTKFEALEPAAKERVLGLSPMHRPGEADEVAAAFAFLLSEQASFVSGVELPVDGAYLTG